MGCKKYIQKPSNWFLCLLKNRKHGVYQPEKESFEIFSYRLNKISHQSMPYYRISVRDWKKMHNSKTQVREKTLDLNVVKMWKRGRVISRFQFKDYPTICYVWQYDEKLRKREHKRRNYTFKDKRGYDWA